MRSCISLYVIFSSHLLTTKSAPSFAAQLLYKVHQFFHPVGIDGRIRPSILLEPAAGEVRVVRRRILRKELQHKGLTLDAAFAVVMPESNVCFSFLHLDTKESEERKIAAAQERMPHITDLVAQKARNVEELVKGAIPFTFTYVIGGYYNKHLITDEKFWVDAEQCILCGLCARRCPVDDIEGIPPRWKHNGSCTNCLACYHYCPTHAIHWGNMQRGQYYFNKREDQK